MSHRILLLVLIVALTACSPLNKLSSKVTAPAEATATAPVPAVGLTPTAPETPTSTAAAPTATATAEASPTPAGPKEGDTKVENGYTYTYTVVKTADGKEAYEGWFRPMTPTAIPLFDWTTYVSDDSGGWKLGKDIVPITMFVEEGVPGADAIKVFSHTELAKPAAVDKTNPYEETLNGEFVKYIYGTGSSSNDGTKMNTGLQSGTIKYPIQYGSKEYDWYPSPEHGVVVYVFNYKNP